MWTGTGIAPRVLFALAVFGLLLTAACGGSNYGAPGASIPTLVPAQSPTAVLTTTSAPRTIKLDLSNYQFTPVIVEVEAGKVARFELVGDGLAHTFTVRAIGVNIEIPEGAKSKTVEFTVPQNASGDLVLTCSFHELAGMVGTLRVK